METEEKILFLDTETTGVDEEDRLCQVAFETRIESRVQGLFKPPIPISLEAMAIHHITEEMVADSEVFKGSVMDDILKDLLPEYILVAHNAKFDISFLEKEGLEVTRHICTLKIAHHYDVEHVLTNHKLQYLRYFYKLDFGDQVINPHDAMSDVIVLRKLYEYYSQFYTADEMVAISSKPILLYKAPFGKHRGKTFELISKEDPSYLTWMVNNIEDMDENLEYTVNYWINNK